MSVKTYYVSKVGNTRISPNFKVKEFQSHDGADAVLIDDDLVTLLQRVRDHFGRPVTITSGYRTAGQNAKVGGSKSSFHTRGRAADIQVSGVNPAKVAMYLESIGAGGIGLYTHGNGFVHVDTRGTRYRWLQTAKGAKYEGVNRILPTLKKGGENNTIQAVKLLQYKLGVSQSGTFGDTTENAVRKFQLQNGLKVDGIAGKNTWNALFS